jgi:hypothetical protein
MDFDHPRTTLTKHSLGSLRKAKKTKDRSPDLTGQLTLQRDDFERIAQEFVATNGQEISCDLPPCPRLAAVTSQFLAKECARPVLWRKRRKRPDSRGNPAMRSLAAVIVIWIVALGDWRSFEFSSIGLFGRHIDSAKTYDLRSEKTEVIGEFYKAIDPQASRPSINVVDLSPMEGWRYRSIGKVTSILRWDHATGSVFSCRVIGPVWQPRSTGDSNSCLAEKCLRPPVIDETYLNRNWFVRDERHGV